MYAVPAYLFAARTASPDIEYLLPSPGLLLTLLPVVCYSSLPFTKGSWRDLQARRAGKMDYCRWRWATDGGFCRRLGDLTRSSGVGSVGVDVRVPAARRALSGNAGADARPARVEQLVKLIQRCPQTKRPSATLSHETTSSAAWATTAGACQRNHSRQRRRTISTTTETIAADRRKPAGFANRRRIGGRRQINLVIR